MPRTAFTPAIATLALGSGFTLALGSCGDANPSAGRTDVAIDTIGDTIVVRTLSGSVWEGVTRRWCRKTSIGETGRTGGVPLRQHRVDRGGRRPLGCMCSTDRPSTSACSTPAAPT